MQNILRFKTQLFILFLLIGFTQNVFGQNLSGTVKDSRNKEPLIGATVLIKGTSRGAAVDLDGNFNIALQDEKPPFTLVVSFVGYTPKEIEVNSITQKINVVLETNEKILKEVEIVDSRLTEKQRESPLTVEALDLLAIKETPAANFYDGLGALKGVDLTAASLGFKIINTRGFNSTSPVRSLQIIDGVDNQAPGLNFSLGNFLGASELDVLKVDIIVGASSAFYGPNAFNGVISMSTKNPFDYTGLSAMAKVGERNLFEGGFRYAQKFKNKAGEDKFAFKLNASFMRAYDWVADNLEATDETRALAGRGNPGGWDAVNRYGDEELGGFRHDYRADALLKRLNPGLGVIHRTGYNEEDLVDYNTKNVKLAAAFHYKLNQHTELIYSSSFGTGTTVYQGENRFSLRDILFFQNRMELKYKDKGFIRAYATHEDAGRSYDAVVTAFELQNLAVNNDDWKRLYTEVWNFGFGDFTAPRLDVRQFDNYPFPVFNEQIYDEVMAANNDRLLQLHQMVRGIVDGGQLPNTNAFFVPGTSRFDSAFAAVTSLPLSQGGSLLIDRSALYHVHGEYKYKIKRFDFTSGANYRLYRPVSDGTIFSDTAGRRIFNSEFGLYTGAQIKFLDDKLRWNATVRVDKNQNFEYISTQSISAIYSPDNNHTFRVVMSSAVRNPTLQDQYLNYNVGRAILLGNLAGKDSLVEINSFINYLNTLNPENFKYFDVDPIRPERVRTFEIGYRATLFKRLFVDMSYYYSTYRDFIGFKVGLDLEFTGLGIPNIQAYRLSANTNDIVNTEGFSLGLNYYFWKRYAFNGNYSYNILYRPEITDEIITAFNTPLNKFNLGISGREIQLPFVTNENFGFSVNYKWVQGFTFEGAPQFTGSIPSYGLVDAQINYSVPRIKSTFKLGASNILNNKVFMVYGGPRVGRLGYFSIVVDIPN
jgi:outer membrane receptor protein involved in Fe transport